MSKGTKRIDDLSDLYAHGTNLEKGTRKEYKLYVGLTQDELDETLVQLKSMRVGLEVDVVFKIFGAVVICTQFED